MDKKFGINVLGQIDGMSVCDHIDMIADVGFRGVFTGWSHEEMAKRTERAAKRGLFFQSIHAPYEGVDAVWREGEEGRAFIDTLSACLLDCANYSIPIMVLHPYIGFGRKYEANEIGLDNFARLVDLAVKHGVKLAFENVEGEEYLSALMHRFKNVPEVGFCFDSGHELCYNRGKDMLSLYGDRLFHTHLNDNVGVTGESIYWTDDLHLVPTDGKADWQSIAQRIAKTPYRDLLMCELTLVNKPNKHTHDAYIAMKIEDFYAYALEKVQKAFA